MSAPAAPGLALLGGTPVRSSMLPYGRQEITDADIAAVTEVLRSAWLTTGPNVARFEEACAARVGASHAIAVNNGTAALHAAMHALSIGPGDEVIVPAMTFAASANCVVYQGGTPVFADVDPDTLLVDPASIEARLTPRTKAIVAVDYAGQPCDYAALLPLAERHNLPIVADGCHALGGAWRGQPVGSITTLTTFSFHPVKHITTGEGGLISTNDEALAARMRVFRNHGITSDHRQREAQGGFFYEMVDLGFNYRLTDVQCALGVSQISRLDEFIARRRAIAAQYDRAFAGMAEVQPLGRVADTEHAYHLYVVQLEIEMLSADRGEMFSALRAENIGANVHYVPVHLHPFYKQRFGTARGLCPAAEHAYERLLSLPMFPGMSDDDVADVIAAVGKVVGHYRR